MGKLNLGKYKQQTEQKSGKGSRIASRNKKTPVIRDQTPPHHLEDLLITKEELWAFISPKAGALKNWLTMSHPDINILKRDGPLAEITNYVNLLLADKLKKK